MKTRENNLAKGQSNTWSFGTKALYILFGYPSNILPMVDSYLDGRQVPVQLCSIYIADVL